MENNRSNLDLTINLVYGTVFKMAVLPQDFYRRPVKNRNSRRRMTFTNGFIANVEHNDAIKKYLNCTLLGNMYVDSSRGF